MGAKGWIPVLSGPLAPFAAGYRSWLGARGYSAWTVNDRLGQLELVRTHGRISAVWQDFRGWWPIARA